ncbi:MAG TPA: hypothetical protein VMV19_21180 [Xanthobacteraceae bacterium]|nr:hypothetical protein [Xanthobacteraceae bacterium]
MRVIYRLAIIGIIAAMTLVGSGWIPASQAGAPGTAPPVATDSIVHLLASLESHQAPPQMSVRGGAVAQSCIAQGQACVINGTPCCGTATCQGKFPNTTCQ